MTVRVTPTQWRLVTEGFEQIAALPPAAAAERLRQLAEHEPVIAAEIAALLVADVDDAFLHPGAVLGRRVRQGTGGELIGDTIGTYQVLREIGRGGMGIVYLAQHIDPGIAKKVAIKTLRLELDQPELAWRFRRERQILSRLEHPNIAALYDGGTTDNGVPYLAMEYVDGERIDSWCDRKQLSISARIDLFRQVCQAVHFAHSKLVVHRDLKPTNIHVTSDGVVKLLDFGIAKLAAADENSGGTDGEVTKLGSTPMTTAYASPEQARGDGVTTASDVYSLGVVLCRLLTGRVPFPPGDLSSHRSQPTSQLHGPGAPSRSIAEAHPMACGLPTVVALANKLRGDLDSIVLMALREEPSRRYPSADAFSADLLRYLKGLPVHAKRDTVSYRVGKFIRRQRALVASIAMAFIVMASATVVSVRAAQRANIEAAQRLRVGRVLIEMLSAGSTRRYTSLPTLLTVLDSARLTVATEFSADPETRAELYEVFGSTYFRFSQHKLAFLMLDSARALRTQIHGRQSLAAALDIQATSDPLFALGASDSALARRRDAVGILRALRPVPQATLIAAEIGLAFMEISLLQSDSSLARMASSLRREVTTQQPRWNLVAMGEAVTLMPYLNRQRVTDAESAFVRSSRAMARDTSDSQETKSALAFQGQFLMLTGRSADAEPRVRRVLAMTLAQLGSEHYLTAQAQNLLAKVLFELRRDAEGRAMIDSAIANNRRAAATDPMYFGEMYLTRAGFEIRLGDWPAAARSLTAAAEQRERLGAQRPILDVSIMYTQATLREAQGQVSAASKLFRQAVDVAERLLPVSAKNRAVASAKLAAFVRRHPGA